MNESPTTSSSEPDRGRSADTPSEIPLRGWRDIFWRMWTQIGEDNMFIIAAGVAFYAMLAIFPAITAFVSLFGLITDARQVQDQFANFRDVMPEDAWSLLNDQLTAVVSASTQSLGVGAIVGLLFALWTAGAGVRAMMSALNVAYREHEKRSFLAFYLTAFLFTIAIVFLAILAVGLIVFVPVILAVFEPGGLTALLAKIIPWSVMAVFLVATLGAVYRFGASRAEPKTRWVSWGAVLATVLWIAASVGFSVYVSHFNSYNETYGALGAVMILLMWLWISAFIVLLGAELNAEMEHQTERDTTTGRPRPLGERGAFVADHVGDIA